MSKSTVVVKKSQYVTGAPMEANPGVRDWKVIYPELVENVRTLCLGIVEVDPGCKSPMHRHNCEEVYYILQGKGYIEIENEIHELEAGDAVYISENRWHRMVNTGDEPLRWVDVGGIMFTALWPTWPTESPYEIIPDKE